MSQHSLGEKPGDPLTITDVISRSASAAGSSVLYTPDLTWRVDGKDFAQSARRLAFELHSAFTSDITLIKPYNLSEP